VATTARLLLNRPSPSLNPHKISKQPLQNFPIQAQQRARRSARLGPERPRQAWHQEELATVHDEGARLDLVKAFYAAKMAEERQAQQERVEIESKEDKAA
jgi:arginase family enzyme